MKKIVASFEFVWSDVRHEPHKSIREPFDLVATMATFVQNVSIESRNCFGFWEGILEIEIFLFKASWIGIVYVGMKINNILYVQNVSSSIERILRNVSSFSLSILRGSLTYSMIYHMDQKDVAKKGYTHIHDWMSSWTNTKKKAFFGEISFNAYKFLAFLQT